MTGAGLDHAVCGGFAVAIHGYPRLTQDIDLLILPGDLERAREILRPLGYDVDGGMLVLDAGKPTEHRLWRVSKVEGEDVVTFVLLIVEGELLVEVWHDRECHTLGTGEVSVVSKPGLARMKQAAGRPKDLDDLEGLGLPEATDGP